MTVALWIMAGAAAYWLMWEAIILLNRVGGWLFDGEKWRRG